METEMMMERFWRRQRIREQEGVRGVCANDTT